MFNPDTKWKTDRVIAYNVCGSAAYRMRLLLSYGRAIYVCRECGERNIKHYCKPKW